MVDVIIGVEWTQCMLLPDTNNDLNHEIYFLYLHSFPFEPYDVKRF